MCQWRGRPSAWQAPNLSSLYAQMEITISGKTILRIAAGLAIGYVLVRLWPLTQLLFISLLLALSFQPLLLWTARHRWPHWLCVLVAAIVLLGSAGAFVGLVAPAILVQGQAVLENLPAYKQGLMEHLPLSRALRSAVDHILGSQAFSDPGPLAGKLLALGTATVMGMTGLFLVLIVTLYFLANGAGVYRWMLAFLPELHRQKMGAATEEIGLVVSHYMLGQLITSALCAAYSFLVLFVLHVPNALLLAAMAGVFDVIPLIGVFLFTIPAMVMALTVSPQTALLVGSLYGAYHLVENYFIVPRVYGDRLKLSPLAVLISCLAAGSLAGAIGIFIVLPVVASYPIIERIWLRPYLQRDTVKKHAELEAERTVSG
jgi:predicted PurR-regulated permease PerM